jgi:hypothetical protein
VRLSARAEQMRHAPRTAHANQPPRTTTGNATGNPRKTTHPPDPHAARADSACQLLGRRVVGSEHQAVTRGRRNTAAMAC